MKKLLTKLVNYLPIAILGAKLFGFSSPISDNIVFGYFCFCIICGLIGIIGVALMWIFMVKVGAYQADIDECLKKAFPDPSITMGGLIRCITSVILILSVGWIVTGVILAVNFAVVWSIESYIVNKFKVKDIVLND